MLSKKIYDLYFVDTLSYRMSIYGMDNNKAYKIEDFKRLEERFFEFRKLLEELSVYDFKYCTYEEMKHLYKEYSLFISDDLKEKMKQILRNKRKEKILTLKDACYFPELNDIDFLNKESIVNLDRFLKQIFYDKRKEISIESELLNNFFKCKKAKEVYCHKTLKFLLDNKIIEKMITISDFSCVYKHYGYEKLTFEISESNLLKHKKVWELNKKKRRGKLSKFEDLKLKDLKSKNFGIIRLYNEECCDLKIIDSLENLNECYKEKKFIFAKEPDLLIEDEKEKEEAKNISINELKKLSYKKLKAKFRKIIFFISDDLKEDIFKLILEKKEEHYKKLGKAHYIPQLNEIDFLYDSEIYNLDKFLFEEYKKHEKFVKNSLYSPNFNFKEDLKKFVFTNFNYNHNSEEVVQIIIDFLIKIGVLYTIFIFSEFYPKDVSGLYPFCQMIQEDYEKHKKVWMLEEKSKSDYLTEEEKNLLKKYKGKGFGVFKIYFDDEYEDYDDIVITSQEEFKNYNEKKIYFIFHQSIKPCY